MKCRRRLLRLRAPCLKRALCLQPVEAYVPECEKRRENIIIVMRGTLAMLMQRCAPPRLTSRPAGRALERVKKHAHDVGEKCRYSSCRTIRVVR